MHWKETIAGGLVAVLVGSLFGEENQPHGEFQAVAPNAIVGIAPSGGFSNSTAQIVISYHPAALSLESLIPHDHLVIEVASLTPPIKEISDSVARSDIHQTTTRFFLQKRQTSSRLKLDSPRVASRRNFHFRRT